MRRGGLLAAAMTMLGCSMFNVPSGPGLPVGPSFRTPTHVLTLIATDEPHPPKLQPNQVQIIPQRVGLLLTPLDGSAAPPIVEIARNVQRSPKPDALRIIALSGDRLWISAGETYVYDLKAKRLSSAANPPKAERPRDFISMLSNGWKVSETRWIGVHLPDDVANGRLKPGSFVMPGIFQLRSVPYEQFIEGQIPKRERRKLYIGEIDPSGPIPRFASMEPIGDDEYSNGVVLKETAAADGALIAYEGRFPDLTLHVRRVDSNGKALWTVDTRITRDPEILPGGELMVLRGVPRVPSGKFPQPILVFLNARTGEITRSELRW